MELAAELGDPAFSANGMNPVTRYAELIHHYRSRWAQAGRDPADALVGAGPGETFVTRDSHGAVAAYRPVYERFAAMVANFGQLPGTLTVYDGYVDFLARGSALAGRPEQVIDKVGRYHEAFGNQPMAIGATRASLAATSSPAAWSYSGCRRLPRRCAVASPTRTGPARSPRPGVVPPGSTRLPSSLQADHIYRLSRKY